MSGSDREILFADLLSAVEREHPELGGLLVRYLAQSDPPEDRPEAAASDDALAAKEGAPAPPPDDAWTMQRLRSELWRASCSAEEERRGLRRDAWRSIAEAPYAPPRLKLGGLLIDLYENHPWAHSALLHVFEHGRLGWGMWQGFKRVFKLAEQRYDLAMFGVLAYRLEAPYPMNYNEMSGATMGYMRRRAWRFLRQLGRAIPELYPEAAIQVLKHYPAEHSFYSSWVAAQIWTHKTLIGSTSGWCSGPPDQLDLRAFPEAWKLSPDPLLRLLEDAQNEQVAEFAIRCLKHDHQTVRVSPEWIARVGRGRLKNVHEFVVSLLEGSPEFHQSKLAELGLHDVVIGFLDSESSTVRRYAIEYARSQAVRLANEDLVALTALGFEEVRDFALSRLESVDGRELGLANLVELLLVDAAHALAEKKLLETFSPSDIDQEVFTRLALGGSKAWETLHRVYSNAKVAVPASAYCALLEDERTKGYTHNSLRKRVIGKLAKRRGEEIGFDWVKRALLDSDLSHAVSGWLKKGMFKGSALDVEWLKGLVVRPQLRRLALEILGNRELVEPARLELGWLLAMARQSDEAIHLFAQRLLLVSFEPRDFHSGKPDEPLTAEQATERGLERLWRLVTDGVPQVRQFAHTYLHVHHPTISRSTKEARSLGITARLDHSNYSWSRIEPLLRHHEADVRTFASKVARAELLNWGEVKVVYELARSKYSEPRRVAADALLRIGEPDAGKEVPPLEWLEAQRTLSLCEAPVKATREIGLTLVRRHYARLGGPQRLEWLMESPFREVRLFAVRMLWDHHAPRPGGRSAQSDGEVSAPERFENAEALRAFLRTVMFGLPPGRMERRTLDSGALPDRALPASVAKKRLVEVVTEVALKDILVAEVVSPVLQEILHSQAKGEWQAAVSSLARLRRAHPSLDVGLPEAIPYAKPGSRGKGRERDEAAEGRTS